VPLYKEIVEVLVPNVLRGEFKKGDELFFFGIALGKELLHLGG
jgi:hypothetical protein